MTKAGNMANNSHRCHRFLESYVMQRDNDDLAACEHGHLNCSTRDGGPCLDELAAAYESRWGEPLLTD